MPGTEKSYRVTTTHNVKVRLDGEFTHVDRFAVFEIGGGQDPVFFREVPTEALRRKTRDRLREMGWEVLGELELTSWGTGEYGRVSKIKTA